MAVANGLGQGQWPRWKALSVAVVRRWAWAGVGVGLPWCWEQHHCSAGVGLLWCWEQHLDGSGRLF